MARAVVPGGVESHPQTHAQVDPLSRHDTGGRVVWHWWVSAVHAAECCAMDRVDGGASLWRRVVREYTASLGHRTTSGDSGCRSPIATSRIRVLSTRVAAVEGTLDLSDVSLRVAPAIWTAQFEGSGLEEERERTST